MLELLQRMLSALRLRSTRQEARRRSSSRPSPTELQVARLLIELDATVAGRHADIDSETASDLELDALFSRIDRSVTAAGAQLLYHDLRHSLTGDCLERRRHACSLLVADTAWHERVAGELARLADRSADYLPLLLWTDLPQPRLREWQLRLFGLGFPLCVGAAFLLPQLALLAVVWFVANVWLAHSIEQTVRPQIDSLRGMVVLLAVARKLSKDTAAPFLADALSRHADPIRRFERRARGLLMSLHLLDLGEYLNAIFLYRATGYAALRQELLQTRPALQQLFLEVAEIDVSHSIVCLRSEQPRITEPILENEHHVRVAGLWNPLVDAAVANDLTIGDRGVLITGANMSGKSTLLKALGISALLARSIGLVCAERWEGPRNLIVRTAFHSRDDLLRGESFFFAEASRALELVRGCSAESPVLFLIDELFKGTNPEERTAAAAEIMLYLEQRNFVVAASHDLALWNHVSPRFDALHFGTAIGANHELLFDFRLHPGHAKARHAISTLAALGFPEEIVTGARQRLQQNGRAPGFPQS